MPQPVDVKGCPTCGREVAESVGVCDSCEAWATALVQPRPDDDMTPAVEASNEEADPPALAATPVVPGAPAATAPRRLTVIAAGIAVVALTGFAISVSGGSEPAAPASAAPPATEVRPAPTPAPAPVAATPSVVQTWRTENRSGDYRRSATFELPSENVVKTWFGPARASLVVRCTARSIEAFVVTGSPMKIEPRVDGKTVTVRVDGEPARTEQWTDSDDHTAVFAPDPAAFVQRLRKARTFDFGYSPHNSTEVVAQFSVTGIDGLMNAASRQCGTAK